MPAIAYPPNDTPPTNPADYTVTPWEDPNGKKWLYNVSKNRWSPFSNPLSNVSFSDLADGGTVDLPALNGPLNAALLALAHVERAEALGPPSANELHTIELSVSGIVAGSVGYQFEWGANSVLISATISEADDASGASVIAAALEADLNVIADWNVDYTLGDTTIFLRSRNPGVVPGVTFSQLGGAHTSVVVIRQPVNSARTGQLLRYGDASPFVWYIATGPANWQVLGVTDVLAALTSDKTAFETALSQVGVFPIVNTNNHTPASHQALQVGQFALTGQYHVFHGSRRLWVCIHGSGEGTIWSLVMPETNEKINFVADEVDPGGEGEFDHVGPYIFTLVPAAGSGGEVYSAALPFAGNGQYVVKVTGNLLAPNPFNSFTFGRPSGEAGLVFSQLTNGVDGYGPFPFAETDHAANHTQVRFIFHGSLPDPQRAIMHMHISANAHSPIQVYGNTGHGNSPVNINIEFIKLPS